MDRNELKNEALKLIESCKELNEFSIANSYRQSKLAEYINMFKSIENLTEEEVKILEELEHQLNVEKNIRPHNEFEQMEAKIMLRRSSDYANLGRINDDDDER